MISEGIIELCSSEYASPVMIVKKKILPDYDYRKLNRLIVKHKYPLSIIEDQIDRLAEVRIFSTIDLKNGFFHVEK